MITEPRRRPRPILSMKARQRAFEEGRRAFRLKELKRRLDKAKEIMGSDWKTAQRIHVSPSRLSDIRAGRRPIPAHAAVRLAKLLNEQPFTALARNLADGAKTKSIRHFWQMVGVGQWPFVQDNYYDWAHSGKRKKFTYGGQS